MLVKRVVEYLKKSLNCEEITSRKVVHPYRKFKAPNSDEKFYVTDTMVFIGQTYNCSRPAPSIVTHASEVN